MRTTDIKHLIELKKKGQEIYFSDCPSCRRFFGSDVKGIETCSIECEAEYALTNLQFDVKRKNKLSVFSLSKPFL